MSEVTLIRDRDGDLRVEVDSATAHHWRCDGEGFTAGPRADRVALACPVCRPHLAGRVGPKRRRSPVLAD